jgi:threonine dehydrogenase-like Zn-dependent dehydrogenase
MVQIDHNAANMPRALWYEAPGRAALRPAVAGDPDTGSARVRTLWSGISRGTERLVFNGQVPASEFDRMRGPNQEGEFPHPVKYGYCAVGMVEAGPDELLGRTVFALHPHQSLFVAPCGLLTVVPDMVPPRRAVLAANMETALNALWDSGAGPGDRIAVVGGGVVGLLVTALAAALPGAEVTLIDVDRDRAEIAGLFGAAFEAPEHAAMEADIVFHTSGVPAGLDVALALAGNEATVIELSWYGDKPVTAMLGRAFHSRRIRLISSQVGQVAPSRRPRWTYARRMAMAMRLLADARFDALIGDELAFDTLPETLPGVFAPGASGLAPVIRYGE